MSIGSTQKFMDGCFLLARHKEESIIFLGTAFLIHEEGYLLTAAHLLEGDFEGLMIARGSNPEEFTPLTLPNVSAMAVDLSGIDEVHNVALLKLRRERPIETPDHLVGVPETTFLGSDLTCLGYALGHDDIHALFTQKANLCAKVKSPNGTNLIIFDSMIRDGQAGAPLISDEDGRVIGVVMGRFEPVEEGGDFAKGKSHPGYHTNLSYAVSIEYASRLLEKQGVESY